MHSHVFFFPLFANFGRFDGNLVIIFAFVVCLVLISGFFRHRRQELWHQTARLALEKGQPLPAAAMAGDRETRRCDRRWGPWGELRRGLVLVAVGVALYFCLNADARDFAAIPAFIGVAYLLLGLFGVLRAGKSSRPDDGEPADKP